MKVSDLIAILQEFPGDALVVQARDAEGNGYSPVDDVTLGRYAADSTWSGEYGLYELTAELKAEGFSEEDVPDGPSAVCIHPVN